MKTIHSANEATAYADAKLADEPKLLGTSLQQRMWINQEALHEVPAALCGITIWYWGMACGPGSVCVVAPSLRRLSALGIQVP